MHFPGRVLSTAAVAAAMTVGLVGAGRAQDATPAAPGGAAVYPNHFHVGTCAEYDPTPAIPLADLQFPDWLGAMSDQSGASGAGTMPDATTFGNAPIPVAAATTEVPMGLADLVAGKYALNVHNPENPDKTVVCGNLGGVPDDRGDLFIGLGETEGSGYSGVAWLHDNGSSTTVVVFLANPVAQSAVESNLAAMMAAAAAEATPMASPVAGTEATPEIDMSATPVT